MTIKMNEWNIYCEESGDKGFPWKAGSSHFYIISAVLVREKDDQYLQDVINKYKYKILRMGPPLEWKKLRSWQKRDDSLLSSFLNKIKMNAPEFFVSNVICNKQESTSTVFSNKLIFMNYLYGLMFKRISWFLKKEHIHAKLIIDRNTDKLAQQSLKKYLSDVSEFSTGSHPQFSKPKWINPEENPNLGLADFISGVSLRALENYHNNVSSSCKKCTLLYDIYKCANSNFSYRRSYKQIVEWNYSTVNDYCYWDWRGLLYHPFQYRGKHKNIFSPK